MMRSLLTAIAAFFAGGHVGILTLVWLARRGPRRDRPPAISGVPKLIHIDELVWRGGAPTPAGYDALFEAGVRTIVDLRAEPHASPPDIAGLTILPIPIRDGQPPSPGQVDEFLAAISESGVFVHCSAGVGRTGSMIAAYEVLRRNLPVKTALRRTLAVGPPSLEQIAFILGLRRGRAGRPGWLATAVSRLMDSPRRMWSRARQWRKSLPNSGSDASPSGGGA